jgi:SAM-dependent methyltransferase
VGTGRFATVLSVEVGVDPALGALALAKSRQIQVVRARGEALPFADTIFCAVLFVTLCFVDDPLAALREARRVLKSGGGIVLGLVLAEGPWGQEYRARAAAGHPYYRRAHFLTRADLASLLAAADLHPVRVRSALFSLPEAALTSGDIRDGDDPTAGFTALLVTAKSGHRASPRGRPASRFGKR